MLQGMKGVRFRRLRGWRIPGVKAVVCYRVGQWIQNKNILIKLILTPFYLFFRHIVLTRWGVDIPHEAQIGAGINIDHFGGIFISKYARIGKNLNISQDVTIGMSGKGDSRGVPVIGDNVYIGPGAKLFGSITIGDNVKIGAYAVIHKFIPNNAVVVLMPGYEIFL